MILSQKVSYRCEVSQLESFIFVERWIVSQYAWSNTPNYQNRQNVADRPAVPFPAADAACFACDNMVDGIT